jgi:hypothetical protein
MISQNTDFSSRDILYNWFKFMWELYGTWHIYMKTEIISFMHETMHYI